MTLAVLDASALFAALGEPGSDKVRAVLAESALSMVNIRLVLDPLPIDLIGFDAELAVAAGLLLPATRRAGLSIGDRACLALALRLGVPALTADRSWQSIASAVGVEIVLIR